MNTIDEGKQAATPDATLDTSRRESSSKKKQQRSSSFFQKARQSFMRSDGQRGATVETLRGTTGADFEGNARIHRAGGVSLGCCGWCLGGGSDDKESNKERLLLIKGPYCFVFKDEDAAAPKYAIALANLKAVAKTGHANIVQLQTNLGDVQYEVVFDSSSIVPQQGDDEKNDAHNVNNVAKKFRHVVQRQAAVAETEQVRKRLGHEHLLTKRQSVRYAENIARKKVHEQPDVPITAGDIVANMPISPAM